MLIIRKSKVSCSFKLLQGAGANMEEKTAVVGKRICVPDKSET